MSSRSLLPVCRLGKTDPKLLMRRARDVPENDREKMFWIPDRELLEAWLKLHDVHGKGLGKQPFPPSDDYPMKVK